MEDTVHHIELFTSKNNKGSRVHNDNGQLKNKQIGNRNERIMKLKEN